MSNEKDLGAIAETVSNAKELAQFIKVLLRDFSENPDEWENPNLADYLEAMHWVINDSNHPDAGRGLQEPMQFEKLGKEAWKTFARILMYAGTYE